MTTIILDSPVLSMINCGVPEYAEATHSDVNEEDLIKAVDENIECIIAMPTVSKDYI
jgi:hypothetical protein